MEPFKRKKTSINRSLVMEREARIALEDEISIASDKVFAVGPRLTRFIRSRLARIEDSIHSHKVKQVLCGMHDVQSRKAAPEQPLIMTFGRAEQSKVKGVDLFIKAIGLLMRKWSSDPILNDLPTPKFILRGVPPDLVDVSQKSLIEKAQAIAGRRVILNVLPYTDNRDQILGDIRRASIVVMPSRAEGFGLAPMEAISLGVPVIVSRTSGIGELILNSLPLDIDSHLYCIDVDVEEQQAINNLVEAMIKHLYNPERSQVTVTRLQESLWPKCSWRAAADSVLASLVTDTGSIGSLFYGPLEYGVSDVDRPDIYTDLLIHLLRDLPINKVTSIVQNFGDKGYVWLDPIPASVFDILIHDAEPIPLPFAHPFFHRISREVLIAELVWALGGAYYHHLDDIQPELLFKGLEGTDPYSARYIIEVLSRVGYKHLAEIPSKYIEHLLQTGVRALDPITDIILKTDIIEILAQCGYRGFDDIPMEVLKPYVVCKYEEADDSKQKHKMMVISDLIHALKKAGYRYLDQLLTEAPAEVQWRVNVVESDNLPLKEK